MAGGRPLEVEQEQEQELIEAKDERCDRGDCGPP
jgi:hypothetical protein